MRTDYEILREIIGGFSDPDAAPTSDGLAARRPRRPLDCEVPDALAPQADGPYPYDLRQTFERRSSTTDYAPEPLDAAPLLASVQAALVEEAEAWGEEADVVGLEPSNSSILGRGHHEERGDLHILQPQASEVKHLTVSAVEGREAIARLRRRRDGLVRRGGIRPVL